MLFSKDEKKVDLDEVSIYAASIKGVNNRGWMFHFPPPKKHTKRQEGVVRGNLVRSPDQQNRRNVSMRDGFDPRAIETTYDLM